MYLVDTNVISQGAPPRRAIATALADWMDRHSDKLYLSSMTIAEIEGGIAKSRRDGAARKADDLSAWLETVLHLYGNRVLALDAEVARRLGQLSDHARALGRPPGLADLIIAATAAHHGLIILSRNVKHFAPLGVTAHDPFTTLPPVAP
jgi:predicted nucleic acid-binding protein